MIPDPRREGTGETRPKEAGPQEARPKEARPKETRPKEAGYKEEEKKENIEPTGEEEIDHGYEGPVNTKEKKNHNETKAEYQAGREKSRGSMRRSRTCRLCLARPSTWTCTSAPTTWR